MKSKIETYKENLEILNSTNENLMDLVSEASKKDKSNNFSTATTINKILKTVLDIKNVSKFFKRKKLQRHFNEKIPLTKFLQEFVARTSLSHQ